MIVVLIIILMVIVYILSKESTDEDFEHGIS